MREPYKQISQRQPYKRISQRHIFDGGTLITNFPNRDKKAYQDALDTFAVKYGPHSLEISDFATCSRNKPLHDCCSLHSRTGSFPENIREFWAIKNVPPVNYSQYGHGVIINNNP